MAFLPSDIAGLITACFADFGTYQDAGGTTPATVGGDTVKLWKDQYGPGNDLNVSAGTPTLSVRPLDNRLAVHTAAPALLRRASWLGGALSQPYTVLVVYELETAVASFRYVFDGGQVGARCAMFYNDGAGALQSYAGSQVSDTTGQYPDPRSLTVVVPNGAASKTLRDGWPMSSVQNLGANTMNGVTLGAAYDGTTGGTSDYVAVLVYAGDVTADPLYPTLLRYLAARCGTGRQGLVYSGGLGYNAFPALCLTASKKLVAVWRNGTGHATQDGTLKQATSADGETWTAAADIYGPIASTTVDINVGLTCLPSGRLLLPHVNETAGGSAINSLLHYSDDEAATWAPLGTVAVPAGYTWVFAYGRILNPSGDSTNLEMPAYALKTAGGHDDALYLQSSDGGVNWTLKGVIDAGDGTPFDFTETAVLSTGGSNRLAVYREDNALNLYAKTSADGGATWGTRTLLFHGVGPDLSTLASGKTLLTCVNRNAALAPRLEVRLSADSGATWAALSSSPYVLFAKDLTVTGTNTFDYGYPATVQFPDGTLVSVYYGCQTSGTSAPNILWSHYSVGPPTASGLWPFLDNALDSLSSLGMGSL